MLALTVGAHCAGSHCCPGTDLDGLWPDRDDPSFSAHRSLEDSLFKSSVVFGGVAHKSSDAKSSQPPPLALSEARVVVLQSLNRYVYLVVCRHPKVPILEICPSEKINQER